ncbi:MAG: TolC family protein [Syntrophobacteraceae bacterium]|jgi:outer membrane protein TolC
MIKHSGVIVILSLAALVLLAAYPSEAQINAGMPVKEDPPIEGVMDFARCVGVALQQSPYLTRSSLEIEVKRLDVSEAKYSFIPTFSVRAQYYVNAPPPINGYTFKPYFIQFLTDPYNPIEIYFNVGARKDLTKMAVYAHLQIIADYLQHLAQGFLQLESVDQMAEYQNEIVPIAEQNLAFAHKSLAMGGAALLDVDIAEQQLAFARAEKERLATSRATILEGIRNLIGLKPTDPPLELDLKNARYQILNDFNPADATLEQAKSNSFELKSMAIRKNLQEKNVTLTYLRYLPHLVWGVQTADPLTGVEASGLFFTVGLEMPIWDAMKRHHDIVRQKIVLKENIADAETKEFDLTTRWREAEHRLKDASADLKIAEAQQRLAVARERQAEISYRAGSQQLPAYLAGKRAGLDAQKDIVAKKLEYDKAVLGLCALSGDLINHFVRSGSFDEKID